MEQPEITVVINGKAYSLGAGDAEAIGAIPPTERQQLIALLEAVKEQELRANEVTHRALEKAQPASQVAQGAGQLEHRQIRAERLGSGDVDALMSRLVMEESRDRRSVPTRQSLYKWIAVFAVVVIVLILVF
jgi:hypothetical protein